MSQRRSILPLLVGALIAVLLHALALPLAGWWLDRPVVLAQGPEEIQDASTPVNSPLDEQVKEPALPPVTPVPEPARQDPPRTTPAPPPKPERPKAPPPAPVAKRPPAPPPASAAQRGASAAGRVTPPKLKPGDLRPGMDDSPEPLKVTWISHKDYEKMIGPMGPVEQPAIQQEATPTPGAPLIPDPIESTAKGDPRAGGPGGLPELAPPAAVNPVPLTPANAVAVAPSQKTPPPLPDSPRAPVPGPKSVPPIAEPAATPAGAQKNPAGAEPSTPEVAAAPTPPEGINPLLPAPPAVRNPPPLAQTTTPIKPSPAPTAVPSAPQPDHNIGEQLALAGSSAVRMPEKLPRFPDFSPIVPPSFPAGTAKENPDGNPTPGAPPPLVEHVVATTQPAPPSNLGGGRPATGIIGQAGPRPSGAPRAKGEVSPSSLISAEPVTIRAGAVWAGEGLQIHPVVPRTSVGMMYSVPDNPRVRLTFNRQGEVVAAKFLRSTGSDIWDAAILAASYRWKASGKKLDLIGPEGTEQEFTWILGGSSGGGEED